MAIKLTKRQQVFVREYVIDHNASRAAESAGYSKKTAGQIGARLLKNVKVATEIAKKEQKMCGKLEITAENVLGEIKKLAFSNMLDYVTVTAEGEAFVDLSKLTRDQAAAIQEITVDEAAGGAGDGRRERVRRTRFKLADKGLNLERLGRHLKLFIDRVELIATDDIVSRLAAGRKRAAAQ